MNAVNSLEVCSIYFMSVHRFYFYGAICLPESNHVRAIIHCAQTAIEKQVVHLQWEQIDGKKQVGMLSDS